MKYAVVYDDENWIGTDYYDTEAEAIAQAEGDTGEKWADMQGSYSVQGFTDDDIKQVEANSDANPQ